jgi:hypothetical protein
MRALRLCCHRTRVGAGPLDPATHRAHARDHIAQGDLSAALNALLTGACLPIDAADKAGIGADLAAMGVYLAAIGDGDWLGATARLRLRWPPAPCWRRRLRPLWRNGRATAPLPLRRGFGQRAAGMVRRHRAGPAPAYPLRGAKPHVDIVWLEITNFCNQKCTFCPDMHREDSRQWLPLDQVKAVIDQLAEHVSVGSMQLNAYGEPLLHPISARS